MIIEMRKQFEVDDDIAEQIMKLNEKGYETDFCCSGHAGQRKLGYISFTVPTSLDIGRLGLTSPEGWQFLAVDYDQRISMYMTGAFDKEFMKSGQITNEYINKRLKTLDEWINDLPVNTYSYNDIKEIRMDVID